MQQLADVIMLREQAPDTAIEVAALSHIYHGREGQVPALTDISMTVGAGRFSVIVGPSGCGKTSLLMMMAGLATRPPARSLSRGGRSTRPIRIASA